MFSYESRLRGCVSRVNTFMIALVVSRWIFALATRDSRRFSRHRDWVIIGAALNGQATFSTHRQIGKVVEMAKLLLQFVGQANRRKPQVGSRLEFFFRPVTGF